MADDQGFVGICDKAGPDWEDIRTAHWTVSPPSTSPLTKSSYHHHYSYPLMSNGYCADFSLIFDQGREGAYEFLKRDWVCSSVLPRGELQGQGSRLHKFLQTSSWLNVEGRFLGHPG